VELARDAPAFFVLGGEDRTDEVARGLRGAPQLVDRRAQQEQRNRQAGEEELQREDVRFRIGADEQA
jgi:hypothetical protein